MSTPNPTVGGNGWLWLDPSTGLLYNKVAGIWTLVGNVVGVTGVQGATGVQGVTGVAAAGGLTNSFVYGGM